jgi:enamine deaminase RidA (YjgF/YER057c/UK114 family)
METAGGTPDDIVKMTVWITDRALRPILNKHWIGMFPDPHSRPAKRRAGNEPALQIESRFVDLFLNLANAG